MRIVPSKSFLLILLCICTANVLCGCKSGPDTGAGIETRESVKSGLPAGADPNQSRPLTFAEFAAIPDPPGVAKNDPRYEKQRIPAFPNALGMKEGDVVAVRGYLQLVTLMNDGDYNLHFTAAVDSPDNYAIVEIPDDDDVTDRGLIPLIDNARDALKARALSGRDPARTPGTKIATPLYVEITGQLFFSDSHAGEAPVPDNQGLHRATNWQIHPGLSVRFPTSPAH